MTRSTAMRGFAAAAILSLSSSLALPHTAASAAGMPVFDVTNYAQNLLQAARALDQLNNQVKSLQNEASMIEGLGRNLKSVGFPQLQRITSTMQQIDRYMNQAQGIQFKVKSLDQQVRSLFPGALGEALTGNGRVAQARAQLDAATSAYRRSMQVQAQVAENVTADAEILSELAETSQNAVGALQVGQAANQLLALSIKQQLQLQNLMTSEYREAAFERARRVQAEEDGRAATRRFLDGAKPRN